MEQLKEMIKFGKADDTIRHVKELLDKGEAPQVLMQQAMIPAMDEVGDLFQNGEFYLPEMLVAANAMQKGIEVLKPLLMKGDVATSGKILLGTVKGDLHDIGKNIVSMVLEGAGFEVIDIGTDAPPEMFINAIEEHQPQIVGLSALLTTTMYTMKDTIEAIKDSGLRDQVKIMIGGAPINQEFADEIGADEYGFDAGHAVECIRTLTGSQ